MIYMDSAATSFLKPPSVADAVCHAFSTFGNAGRGAHSPTLRASRMIYDTREKLARLFGIDNPSRIAFTCNATESLNTAINGILAPGDHVITTCCEHNSVLRPLYKLAQPSVPPAAQIPVPSAVSLPDQPAVSLTILDTDSKGRICYDALESALRPETKAVVITHASNLTGNVTDLMKISEFTRRHGLLLIVDAAQTAGALPINVTEMGIDILCFTGHKSLLGPQGTGGIYVREGLILSPLKVGGSGIHSFDKNHPDSMPEALEAGTLNAHSIAGLNAALDFILETGVDVIRQKETALARRFTDGLRCIPNVILYSDTDASDRVPIVSLNIGSTDSALVSDILWEDYEICVRAGAHCAPLMHRALGTQKQGAVRFSFSLFNTEKEIDIALQAIREIAADFTTE